MNYKFLDITSKIVLLVLVLFYVWLGFQWDENAPKKKRLTRSSDNSEYVESKDKEEEKTAPSKPNTASLMFRTDSYLSGLSGNVSLNGSLLSSSNLASSNGMSFSKKASTIETDNDSWISIEYKDGFVLIFPKSRVQFTDKEIDIKTGKVYLSGIIQQAVVKSKGVVINRGSSNGDGSFKQETFTEITVLSERNKVRVFSLNDEVTFKIFGKTTTLTKGNGASIFFDARKINQYELGQSIDPIQDSPGIYSWEPKNDPILYNVILRGIKTSNPSYAEYVCKLVQTKQTNITESQLSNLNDALVFTENRYFTWSRAQ